MSTMVGLPPRVGLNNMPEEVCTMICKELHEDWDQISPVDTLANQSAYYHAYVWAQSSQRAFASLRLVNKFLSQPATEQFFKAIVIRSDQYFAVSARTYDMLNIMISKKHNFHVRRLVFRAGYGSPPPKSPSIGRLVTCFKKFGNVQAIHVARYIPRLSIVWRRVIEKHDLFPRLQGFQSSDSDLLSRVARGFVTLSLGSHYARSGCQLIAQQSGLKSLYLGLIYARPPYQPFVRHSPLELTTSSLEILSLGALSVEGVRLARWILASQNSLREITLQWIKLNNGNWEGVFDSMLTCQNLKHLELGFLDYGDSDILPTGHSRFLIDRDLLGRPAGKVKWGPSHCRIHTGRAQDVERLAELMSKPFWYPRPWPGSEKWVKLQRPPTGIYAPLPFVEPPSEDEDDASEDEVVQAQESEVPLEDRAVPPGRRLTRSMAAASQSVVSNN